MRHTKNNHKPKKFINSKITNALMNNFDGMIPNDAMRLVSHVTLADSGCWEWDAYIMAKAGYGQCSYGGVVMTAHRAMLTMWHGVWMPPHIDACHKCDNRKCINPNHMFWGTRKENVQDMVSKGRHNKNGSGLHGSEIPNSKLKESDVIEIRRLHSDNPCMTRTEIAKRFLVSRYTIGLILSGQSWKHTLQKDTP